VHRLIEVLTIINTMLYIVNMPHGDRHPKKDVEAALLYAQQRGWDVEQKAAGHRWGGGPVRARLFDLDLVHA
jgi:hypothetical protein